MSRSASSKCRNLRDVRRDPARVVTSEQFGGGPSAGFLLEINVCQRLSVVVATMKHASVSSAVQGGGKRPEPATTSCRSTAGQRGESPKRQGRPAATRTARPASGAS